MQVSPAHPGTQHSYIQTPIGRTIRPRKTGEGVLSADVTADKLPPPESNAEKDGLVPADVAAYPGEGETTLYCVLWSKAARTVNGAACASA